MVNGTIRKLIPRLLVGGAVMASTLAFAQDKAPVVFGFVTPTTTSWGADVMKGVNLAVKQMNAAGGVQGRPIKLVVYDDMNKPEEGVAAFERLIVRDKAKMLMGSFTSAVSMAEQSVTERYKRLHIVSFAQADSVRDASHPLAFFLNATVGMNLSKYLEYVGTQIKPKRVVVLADSTDYGQSSIDAIRKTWTKPSDPQVIGVERFEPTQSDLSPQITKIKSEKPDAVFIAANSGEAVSNVLTQLHELGVNATRLTVPGILSDSFLKLAGKSAEGLINGDFYFYEQDNPQNHTFVNAFRTEYGYNPSKLEMIGYESVQLSTMLLQKAGVDADDASLAKTLRENTWQTPRGTLKFVPMGKAWQGEAAFTLITVKDGKMVAMH
jgi:branched-chain amino acid transport system substrate-binding protein